jgi:hypothetical protein
MNCRIVIASVMLFMGLSAYASQVVFQKLDDMIGSFKVITAATVEDVKKVNDRHFTYSIRISEVLAGELAAKELAVNYFSPGSPHFSVISPSSGIEHALKEGEKYLFLFQSTVEQETIGVILLRAGCVEETI